jgi:hypothetical protein
MRKAAILSVVAILALACAMAAFGHAVEYAKGQRVLQPAPPWPSGVEDLVNRDGRVYGYMINGDDYFFFAGDTGDFNAFVAEYARVENIPLLLVLHPGKGETGQYGISDSDQKYSFDWQVSVLRWARHSGLADRHPELADIASGEEPRHVVILDLWLGGQVELDKVKVPLNIQVKSGGEIENFIAARKKAGES